MTAHKSDYTDIIRLPEPNCDGEISIENAILNRRSIRDYLNEPLTLTDVSQLLWAAQGITESGGYRAAPSGGALYPLEVYLVAGNVMNLLKGIYRYRPLGHEMIKVADGDMRNELASAALEQGCIKRGAVSIGISAVYERMTRKYGQRGVQYVQMEDKGARVKFEIMAGIELQHYEMLLSYYSDKFGKTPVIQETGEGKIVRPETPPRTATFGEAIKIIMDTERKAYQFYKKPFY